MKIINLVYPDKSDVKYEISTFPDGQQQVTINNYYTTEDNPSVMVKSRLSNWRDLELIVCATQSLKLLGVKEIHLYVPYVLGARSDRQFEEGSNNYLKHVICPILNSQGYSTVTVLDPHSSSLECCINNFKSISNLSLVEWALKDILSK